jgi:plastocyanin
MKGKITTLLVALAVGGFAVAGCGDDDEGSDTGAEAPPPAETTETQPTETTDTATEESGGGGGETLEIEADPSGQLRFDPDKLTAKAGEVTIVMDNPSSLPHAVEIENGGPEAEGETVMKGEKSTAKATLKAGEHKFVCPVPGHEEGGMVGTLTVE